MHTFTRLVAGSKHHATLLAVLVLALVVAGAAVSASVSTSYRGTVKSGGKLSFRTTATSVVGFKASVSPLCVSVASSSSILKVYPVLLQSPKKLTKGHFTITFKGSSSTFITVTGTVKPSSASGRINVRYTTTIGTNIYACSSKTTWTAKKA
ncbi:MAG: hypothetical protein WBQ14_10000 [Gaiellaceae bacterium]